jgi:amino acid adenylation domain-containing protein
MRQTEPPKPDVRATEPPALRGPSHPLTARQSLFWLDEYLYPHVPYHHVVMTLRLTGPLDVDRFIRAYRETILAFDQFRLVFFESGGEPRQGFRADLEPTLPIIELADDGLQPFIEARSVQSFDFQRALFDGVLLRFGEDSHVFYFCQHHIISDGTSVGYFLSDLHKRYAGEQVAPRPSYARYIEFENTYRKSKKCERDTRHFTNKLKGGSSLRLYGRSADDHSIGVHRSVLDGGEERWAKLTALARDERIELIDDSMSRLVAFATVLFAFMYRVSESRSLVIGTPIPNRTAEFLDTGGLIMEQTFLAVEIEDGETFASLAAKVRGELFAGLRHGQHCVSDRGLTYVTLNLLRMPSPRFEGLDTELKLVPAPATGVELPHLHGDGRDRFGIHVFGFEREERLRVGFDFHRNTFDAGLRERAKGHFLALFDAMLSELETPLDAVCLVSPEEKKRVLALGRGAEPGGVIPDLVTRVLEMSRKHPHAPAILSGGEVIDYQTLVKRTAQLAQKLVNLGVTREARVGVCVPRGADEPIAMLATLWAHATYVPLDPSHPSERIRIILDDARPEVLITHAPLVAQLDLPADTRVLLLDEERSQLAELKELQPLDYNPNSLAYVLFTSGSTGRPKGVEIPRGAFANFLRSMAHTPGMAESDRLLAVTTITFDIAGLELFLPLWVGASVRIADRETTLDAQKLKAVLEREPITMLQATPTTWRLLLEAGYKGGARPLRKLCGGEAMSPELARGLVATGGELWNMYGPTETTVWSTLERINSESVKRITVGRAIDHTQIYVLDARGEVLPEGAVGELCIGGKGVARGYRERPELTAEKFIQNPHGAPGDRVYRTGDLARFLAGGELECLGRIDHQVKIRGFRIELGEIESCLRGVPFVRDVVVVARFQGPEARLVAYWVGEGDVSELQARVKKTLPSYMHPSQYVQLGEFPLNTNGKVDRKRLPEPSEPEVRESRVHARFDSDAELRIASMFREVLGTSAVDGDTDFFLLGGDSVRVIELRRRIHEAFGVELSLGTMFDSPTVKRLAASLGPRGDANGPVCVALRRGSSQAAPLFCVLGVALYHPLAQALEGDRTVYGLHVPYSIRQPYNIEPSVEHVASLYVDALQKQVPHGPYHLAGLCFGGVVAYEMARQLLLRGEQVLTVSLFDAWLPRSVSRDPKARLRSLLARARKDPASAVGKAREAMARVLEDVRQKLGPRWVKDAEPGTGADDLLVTGPLARAMMYAFDRHVRAIDRPITLFRALERTEPDWWTLDWDLGWGQVVEQVTVHPIEGSHLGILKAPYVSRVAVELDRALTDSEKGRASSRAASLTA